MSVAFVSLLFMSASIPADVFSGVGDAAFGLVLSSWTIGMIVGALVISRRVPAGLLVIGAFLAVTLQGLGKALAPFWLVFGFMVACYFAGGIGHGLKNVLFRTRSTSTCPRGCTAVRSRPTTGSATAPSSARSRSAASSSRCSARAARSGSPAGSRRSRASSAS